MVDNSINGIPLERDPLCQTQLVQFHLDVFTSAKIVTKEGVPLNPLKLNAALICQQ